MISQKSEYKMEDLAEKLKALSKPVLFDEKKLKIKNHLLSTLEVPASETSETFVGFSFESLVAAIRSVIANFRLDLYQRARIKERVFGVIEKYSQKRFFWSTFFTLQKKLLASALVVMLVFATFNFFNFEMGVVKASGLTVLDSFEGDVLIVRNGKSIPLIADVQIYENDKIVTAQNGAAVIRYFDESVTRLAGNTTLLISNLEQSDRDSLRNHVEITLLKGTLWSKVISLVDSDSSFAVKVGNVYAYARQAVFNMEVAKDGRAEIGVYNHSLDIVAGKEVEKVVSGEKVSVGSFGVGQLKQIAEFEKQETWIQENLESDKQYLGEVEERLLASKVSALDISIDEDFSFKNSLSEDTLLLLTFDDIKKSKLELDLAERAFIAAQIKLYDDNLSEEDKIAAQTAIDDFGFAVENFLNLAEEVKLKDKVYGEQLSAYVRAKIDSHKKDLSIILPDSPIYEVKEVVGDLELLAATDTADLVEIKAEQTLDKLIIAEEVMSKGDYDLATEVLSEYKDDLYGLVEIMDNIDSSDKSLKATTEQVVEDVNESTELYVAIEAEVEELKEFAEDGGQSVAAEPDEPDELNESAVVAEEPTPETTTQGPFGITIRGDKPLPPLLQDIE